MQVLFSKVAEIHRDEILENLSLRWTEKEMQTFVSEYESVIENVKIKLVSYPFYSKKHKIQYALIGNKQVKLFFKIYPKEKTIFVFDFFQTRKDPDNLFKL